MLYGSEISRWQENQTQKEQSGDENVQIDKKSEKEDRMRDKYVRSGIEVLIVYKIV